MRLKSVAALIWAVVLVSACSDDSGKTPSDKGVPADGGQRDGSGIACPKDYSKEFAGVCLAQLPDQEGKRTQCGEIVDDCDKTGKSLPDLACITAAAPAAPSGPTTVTLAGFVDVFSSGPDADDVVVEIYDAKELMKAVEADSAAGKLKTKYFPTSVSPLGKDTVKQVWTDKKKPPEDPTRGVARACPKDNKLKLPCVVPSTSCTSCDLDGGYYCHDTQCIERLRWESRYQIKNIPTNRFLVIRTTGVNGFKDSVWGIMVQFNVYLRADAPKCTTGQYNDCINSKGEFELEVNALSSSDYKTIPITAGLSGGVPEGNGAIAGEVHDCDDVKLSGFQVGTYPTPTVLAYFNGNPIKTLPDLNRKSYGTNIDGLFSALDIDPGKVTVSAAGLVSGKVVSAGTLSVAVLPDSVTVVTFEGAKPAP